MKARSAAELLTDFKNAIAVFLEMPPYQRYELDESNLLRIAQIERFRGTFDCYCVSCGKESTFADVLPSPGNPHPPPLMNLGSVNGGVRDGHSSASAMPAAPKPIPDRSFTSRFVCTRDRNHTIEFHFRVHQRCFLKVGQFPSMADLKSFGLRKYSGVLGSRYQELTKAAGLYAHGLGIGSFVYLRRIFEGLIGDAHRRAATASDWDASQWDDRLRVEDKIRLLSTRLPSFLSENRTIYAILSKGIHELSEDECVRYFPVIRESIEAILDELIAERARRFHRHRVARALKQITTDATTKNVPNQDP